MDNKEEKKELIKMIELINNQAVIKYLTDLTRSFIKKWGI